MGVLPYALAAFILFFIAGMLLVTAIVGMGSTAVIFTAGGGTALPLACGALAFLGFIGPAMTLDAKEAAANGDSSFGRQLIAVLPYSLAAFILFFIGGDLLVTAIVAMGSTAAIFTAAGGTAVPLACGALAFLGTIGPTMTTYSKTSEVIDKVTPLATTGAGPPTST
jgi:hypothetical protein